MESLTVDTLNMSTMDIRLDHYSIYESNPVCQLCALTVLIRMSMFGKVDDVMN